MNFSNIQEWVDGFSALQNYSRVSIDTWYKMRPKLKSYPETFSAINPGFNDSIIDKAIITLAIEKDPHKVDFAKSQLVDRMKEYFSVSDVSDVSVVDMNSALDKSRSDSVSAALTSGSAPKSPAPVSGSGSGTYSYDQSDLVSYIANKHNMKSDDVAAALQEFSSQPYPMSRVVINNILCNRYNFPINDDGEVVSRISKYLNQHIDIKDEKLDRLTLAKEAINKFLPADNFLVMDILNAYMDPNLSSGDLPRVISDLFKSTGSFAPDHVINQLILSLSDIFKRYDMEKQDPSPSSGNFAQKDAQAIMNQTFKDHRLKLAANEVKWIYDTYINSGLNDEETAKALVGVETDSGRPLYLETALNVIKDFRNRAREARVSDGHTVFSNKNFNSALDAVSDLSDIAATAGIDDRFVIDNYNEFRDLLIRATDTSGLLSSVASFLLLKQYASTPEEADLIAQDFVSVLKGSGWAQKYMRNLRNFSRNDLINRMFSLGYTDRDIAIKLHQPLAEVRNFAFKNLGNQSMVNRFIDGLQNSSMFNWMTPSKPITMPGPFGQKIQAPDRFEFMARMAALAGGLYGAAAVARPYVRDAWRKITGKPVTPEEMYNDMRALAEQDRIYRSNQGRMAQAMGNMAEMIARQGGFGLGNPPIAPTSAVPQAQMPSPSGLGRPM